VKAPTSISVRRELSHVVLRLEDRDLVERFPCSEDGRATNARLTSAGWAKVQATAPGHAASVRQHVTAPLTAAQFGQLTVITNALLPKLDPTGAMTASYHRYDDHHPSALTDRPDEPELNRTFSVRIPYHCGCVGRVFDSYPGRVSDRSGGASMFPAL
jgi:hypothetical protein